jgi:hypothetical protein
MSMELTKEEKSLLLYMETQAVDYGGKLESARMNDADFEIAKHWNDSGFVLFGRIAAHDIVTRGGIARSHWCVLSDAAWTAAHTERRARCQRLMDKLTVERIGLAA